MPQVERQEFVNEATVSPIPERYRKPLVEAVLRWTPRTKWTPPWNPVRTTLFLYFTGVHPTKRYRRRRLRVTSRSRSGNSSSSEGSPTGQLVEVGA